MGRLDSPQLKGTWLGRLLDYLNPLVKFVLRSPLHAILDRWFVLLSWKGARSGQARATPVSYIRDGTGIWLTTGDRWPAYVKDNPTFRVRLRGRWYPATASVEPDAQVSQREHVRIFSEHGWFRWLAWMPSKDGRPDGSAIATSIAAGRKLVRLDLRPSRLDPRGSP
jgi:hypothetical protein